MCSRRILLKLNLLESVSWRSTTLKMFSRCDTFDRADDRQFASKKMGLFFLLSPKSHRLLFFVQAATLYNVNAKGGVHGSLYKEVIVTRTLSRSGKKQAIQHQNSTFLNDSVVRGREKSRKFIERLLSTNVVENYQTLFQLIKIVLITIYDFIDMKYLYNIFW